MFTYDVTLITDHGLNQMRFELGDTLVEEPEKTAYLSDEEYLTAIQSSSWKRAKLRLIETLLRRFSYEVDTTVEGLKLNLHQRVEAWEREYKRLKSEVDAEDIASSGALKTSNQGRPPCFTIGMNDWGCSHVR